MNETKDLTEIKAFLENSLESLGSPLRTRKKSAGGIEIAGSKRVMQGKQEVDGFYFASTVQKPKDIRLYFFPIYTDPALFSLSEDLQKMLKGKSCFHIKRLNEPLKDELKAMFAKAKKHYEEKDLI